MFKSSKEKAPTPQEAIQKIRDVEDLLNKKSTYLEKKIEDELDIARKNGTKNKRGINDNNKMVFILLVSN